MCENEYDSKAHETVGNFMLHEKDKVSLAKDEKGGAQSNAQIQKYLECSYLSEHMMQIGAFKMHYRDHSIEILHFRLE